MKLNTTPRAGVSDPMMQRALREVAVQVNLISEGRLGGFYTAANAAPTTGDHLQGDFLLNSAPTEQGTGGSKYVVHGWRCVVSGTPGTWVECRFLTGN